MPIVTFVQPDGQRQDVDLPTDMSVMNAGVNAGVDGILAECGGGLACATCHVYVVSSSGRLTEMSSQEDELLELTAAERKDTSRLSCQLRIEDQDGTLTVQIPNIQV